MTWWRKLFYGNSKEVDRIDQNKRTPINPELGWDPLTGEIDFPHFLDFLESEGFSFNDKRVWWQRTWTTWVPGTQYPVDPSLYKEIFEIYSYDRQPKEWTYRIVNPLLLGHPGGGAHVRGWCIWEDKPCDVDSIMGRKK